MLAWNVTREDVERAAASVGLEPRGLGRKGKTERSALTFRLGLVTAAKRSEDGSLPYQRTSTHVDTRSGRPRRIAAVCWHGHRDFLRALFEGTPDARVKTTLADYRGAASFEDTYRSTHGQGNGWHVAYGQACTCTEAVAYARTWRAAVQANGLAVQDVAA